MSHKKFGPDRFSRFDVYWIQTDRQTDKQTNKQTDKPNLYIDTRFQSGVVVNALLHKGFSNTYPGKFSFT